MEVLEILKKIALWTSVVLVGIIITGILYEQYSRWRLERGLMSGKTFASINGHNIHYIKKGKGAFTVVFQSGLGGEHVIWKDVQDNISKDAVTISYDRSGLFLSEAGDKLKTNASISQELELLLEKTNCPKPYILVGHSMAGIHLPTFINQHKQDVAGVLFVEPAHPLMFKKASARFQKAISAPPAWFIRFVVNTGFYRLLFTYRSLSAEVPVGHPFQVHQRDYFYKSCAATLLEQKQDRYNLHDAEQYNSFGDLPITIISGTSPIRIAGFKDLGAGSDYIELIRLLHQDLLKLSGKSKLVKAEKSGHMVPITEPELIVAEIKKLLPIQN